MVAPSFSAYFPTYRGAALVFEERLWSDDMGDYQVTETITQAELEAQTGLSIEPRVYKRSVALPFSIDEAKERGPNGALILWIRHINRICTDCRFAGASWAETVHATKMHDGGAFPDDWHDTGELTDLAEAAAGGLWAACDDSERSNLITEVQNGAASEWRKLQRRGK